MLLRGCASGLGFHAAETVKAAPAGAVFFRAVGSPDRRIAGSPDRRIAGSPDRRIAGSPDRRIAGSPDRRAGGEGVLLLCSSKFLIYKKLPEPFNEPIENLLIYGLEF
jgi:hypothetical protein